MEVQGRTKGLRVALIGGAWTSVRQGGGFPCGKGLQA